MATAAILINQATKPAGVAGRSRSDLDLGAVVTLTNNDDSGAVQWLWEVLDKPLGSAATLTGDTTASCTFTPDVAGSYFLRLTVNGGSVDQVIAACVTSNLRARKLAFNEQLEFDPGGSAIGWAEELSRLWDTLDRQAPMDAREVGRQAGTGFTDASISSALTLIGSAERTLYLAPGTWVLSNSVTVPENVTLKVARGAVLQIASTKVLTVNGGIDAGRYQIFSCQNALTGTTGKTASAQVVFGRKVDTVPAQWFGCVCDDSTDDTTAALFWLHCISNSSKTGTLARGNWLRVVKHLYWYGGASIVGELRDECGIRLDADLEGIGAGYSKYWLQAGLTGIPSTLAAPAAGSSWTGTLSGLTLKLGATWTTAGVDGTRVLCVHRARGARIHDVAFDGSGVAADQYWTTLVALNDGTWSSGTYTNEDWIVENTVSRMRCNSHDGNGGINLASCKRLIVRNNVVGEADDGASYGRGSGDDPIMLINCVDSLVEGNICYSTHGRIGILGGRRVSIIGNRHTRLKGADNVWLGGDLLVCIVTGTADLPNEDIVISGNMLHHPNGPGGTPIGMTIAGRNITITGNVIKTDATAATTNYGIIVKAYTFGGWTDPDGLDGGATLRPRRILISGNVCSSTTSALYAGRITVTAATAADLIGPIVISGNIAGGYDTYGPNCTLTADNRHANGTATPNTAYRYVYGAMVPDAQLLGTFVADSISTGVTRDGSLGGATAVKRRYVQSPGYITHFVVNLDSAPAGSIDVTVKKSGAAIMATKRLTGVQHALQEGYGYTDKAFGTSEYLTVEAAGVAGLGGTYSAVVQVYGVLFPI